MVHQDELGLTLYLRVSTGLTTSVAVALDAGSGNGAGFYHLDPADLASLPAGTYASKVLEGAPSTSADDPWRGNYTLFWDGDAEIDVAQRIDDMTEFYAGNYRFTDNALAEGPSGTGGGGGGGAISSMFVDDTHRWRFEAADQRTAVNTLREVEGFEGLLAMNFDNAIPDESRIVSAEVTGILDENGGTLTIDDDTNLPVAPDGDEVHMAVVEATPDSYTVIIAATSVDSQVYVRRARLVIENIAGT